MSSILKVDNLQTGAGATHSLSSLGVTGAGSVLQEIYGFCDGRTVAGITFPNVTAVQALTTTHTDLTGTNITYTPPAGTKTVVYTVTLAWHSDDYSGISHFKFLIDSTEVTLARRTISASYEANHQPTFRLVFDYPILIDSTLASDDIANGKLKSWTGAKTLKMQAREYSGSYEATIHKNNWWDGAGASGQDNIGMPTISLKAIA